ncbi:MAG: purine-nucleoside phosphorylase [Vicingaceae bacterium]
MSFKDTIDQAFSTLTRAGMGSAKSAVILGTGLGQLLEEIEIIKIVEYSSIPGFKMPTVVSHEGKMVLGNLDSHPILALDGRLHYYEGFSMKDITFPLYVLKKLGIKRLFVSNAAGNLNPAWNKGDIMMVEDHINLLPENPLRGENDHDVGPRWPDMFEPYDSDLRAAINQAASGIDLTLRKGVYVAVQGPNLETRAEYSMLRNMGADAVGMSTVPEVIVANYLGLPVCALSVLTDDCDPTRLAPVNIKEIMAIAAKAEGDLTSLLKQAIAGISRHD